MVQVNFPTAEEPNSFPLERWAIKHSEKSLTRLVYHLPTMTYATM